MASDFLKKKAQEQAESITERFGEDAYGGAKWRSENSALSSDSLSRLLKQVQDLGTPGATSDTKRTSGGYYSRPTTPDGIEDIYSAVSYLTPALREAAIPVTVAQEGLQAAEADLQIVSDYLQRAIDAYKTNPTAANADAYNQIAARYDEIYQGYSTAYDTYNAAYNKYKTTEDQAVQILNAYQSYSMAQQAAYNDWRGTIRDAASIEADLEAIAGRIETQKGLDEIAAAEEAARKQAEYQARQDAKPWYEKLAEYLGGIQDTTLPTATVTQGMVQDTLTPESAKVSDAMQALLDEKALLNEELDWSNYFFYDNYRNATNFERMSQYVPKEEKEQRWLDILLDNYSDDASPWEDPLYEAVNGNEEAAAWLSSAGASYYGSDNAIGAIYGRMTEGKSESSQMTNEEVEMFNYLYATQGKAAAHQYYSYLASDLYYRERKEQEAYWQQQARENPVGASIFSAVTSPMKGLAYLGQATDFLADGELTENAQYNKFSYIPSAIRETVPENWGAVGTFAYQTGMSMADFLLTTAITGGNQAAALTIMGSGAAADTTLAAKDRGLEDWQAFTLGTIAGLTEILTEKSSLDKLFDADLLADGILKYILGNALAEGSEELVSGTANWLADIIVSKDKSEWMQSINAYMAKGLDEDQAFARAMADQALSLGVDFLGGFVSGAAMGDVGAIVGSVNTQKIGNELSKLNLNEEDVQAFIESGLESDSDTASHKIAVELQKKIEAGEAPSDYDLSRLYQANVQAQPDAGWDSSLELENVSLRTLKDDPDTGEVSAEAMLAQAKADLKAGKISDAEFDSIMDEVMHLEELENGTSVKTFDSQPDINAQADNINTNGNGGNIYGNTQRTAAGSAVGQSTGGFGTQGADISAGVQIRNAGQSTGVQAGQMASSTGREGTQTNSQAKAVIERQNTAGDLRKQGLISYTSSWALGVESGTDTENLLVMPEEYYDVELQRAARFAKDETGLNVAFTVGNIQVNRNGEAGNVRGVYTGHQIVAQCDNPRATATQIVKHEVFHDKAAKDPGLAQRLKEEIQERFTPQEFDAVMDRYIDELWPLYGPADETAWEEYEGAYNAILEEVLADAYAGINAFGAHAEQFTQTVNELTPSRSMNKQQEQDNGAEEPTGPPEGDRYSIETLPDGKKYVRADRQVIFGNDPDSWSEQVEDYINGRIRRGQDVSLIAEDGSTLTITAETAGKMGDNHTGSGATMDDEKFYVKANAAVHVDELAQVSRPSHSRTTPDHGGRHGTFASAGWNYRTAFFMDFDGRYYRLQMSVANGEKGSVPYNIGEIEERSLPKVTGSSAKGGALNGETSYEKSVPQEQAAVKQRFSYAGENANNADMDALARAKEMQAAGVADETIRQQTGWHTGMDGKWRWEIDDSGMRYDSSGDLRGAESAKWAMEDYESARDDLWGRADMDTLDKVRAYNRADIAGDSSTKQALYDELINGPHAYYFDQYVEAMTRAKGARNAPAGGTLQDYIDHPALFEAYPQLRNVSLRFERMGGGNMGYYSRTDNEIVLNTELRYAAEETLVHEIQHAIQKAEGFARGSNVEYWQQRQDSNDAVHVYDAKIQDSERKVDEIMRQLPENVAEQFRRWSTLDESSPEAMDLMQKFWDGPYSDAFEDYWFLTTDLEQMNRNNYKRGPRDLYMNTAGEIEARDSASRRNLTPEQRRAQEPARGDSKTVFMEDSDELNLQLGERFSADDTDSRYSADEETGQRGNAGSVRRTDSGLRENMTTKERDILRGVETRLLGNIGGALGVSKFGDRSYLKSVIQGLSDTYLETGTIEQQAMDDLFEQAYRQGVVVDRELHDQYEEVRKYLHTVSLTLDPRDRSDIADYPDFVKRMRGRMRIVNEGGLPVDSAWHELNDMAPELFPNSIAHPADQLVRMTEVLEALRIAEKSLGDYYGPMASTYKKDAKAEFERAVWESIGELRQIRRYEQERQQKLQEAEPAPTTPEEAVEAWGKLKNARKTYEKAMAKNLLTTEDEIAVGDLLKGKMLPEHLDDNLNVKGVLAVYEAKQEYERLTKLLAEYRRKVKADIRAEADTYLETANMWKDKNVGLLYSREIMQRNVEDIVPDKKLAKAINEQYFEPVRDAEAAAVKMKEEYREAVRKLNLSRSVKKGNLVSEAHAVQLYGEAMDNIQVLEKARGRLKHRDGKSLEEWRSVVYKLWQENPGLDKVKIENAVTEMRRVYDELFQKMNEVRVRWGYEPVNYRQGYFPHFQPGNGDGIMAQFGRVLGIDTQVVALPTTINGLTHTFKPGIQWFGNAQERLGFNTAYDAVEGFDRYIEGVASVICQTESIQKLRALASQIRYRTSDEGIRKQVDAIYSNSTLTEEQKDDAISGIYEKGRYTLSNFVVEVDEYTNLLANKKSKLDRTVEAMIGRKFYTCMKWLESRVGANMIAGNLTSALTNVIPLTQARARLGDIAMLRGMWNTLASYKTDDGIIDRSSFLTNRRGSDPLVKVWSEKVSKVLGMPMELIDNFTSGSIVRAAYYQNLKQGLSESEAMHQADIFASRVMAERSKGGMPTLFESKNPFFKLVTQFQLEVNNQWSEVFKDIPRSQREKGLSALALVFLQYFLGAWLFNNLYEKWIGRRPAMDPIDIVVDAVRDFASDDVSTTDALGNLANNIIEELPFSSALTLIGIETDGGRVPVSSAIPDLATLVSAATSEDWAPEKRWKEAQDELNKLAYVLPPFGGNQVSKVWKGIKAYIEGGSYSVDSDGNEILQYPVYNDEAGDFWGLVQAMLLGKSALPEAQEWVEDGFDSLSAKQTAVYQDMIDAGVSKREAYGLIDSLRGATETDEVSKQEAQIRMLTDADTTDECKAIAFYGLLATDSERALMDNLTDAGALPGAAMDTLIQLRDAAALLSAEKKSAQADILTGSALTEEEKEIIIRSWLDNQEVNENGNLTSLGKFNLAMNKGITTEEYLRFRATGMDIDTLLEYTEAGFDADDAQDLAQTIHDLEPLPGEDRVSTLQKWRASVDFSDDVEDQLIALSMIMEPKSLAVWETANSFGVTPDIYVTFQETATQYDTNGNGSYTQAEAKAAIDAEFPHLTTAQKAVLWQWVCYSSKSKNNPYDPTVGQNFIDSRDAAKAAAEE